MSADGALDSLTHAEKLLATRRDVFVRTQDFGGKALIKLIQEGKLVRLTYGWLAVNRHHETPDQVVNRYFWRFIPQLVSEGPSTGYVLGPIESLHLRLRKGIPKEVLVYVSSRMPRRYKVNGVDVRLQYEKGTPFDESSDINGCRALNIETALGRLSMAQLRTEVDLVLLAIQAIGIETAKAAVSDASGTRVELIEAIHRSAAATGSDLSKTTAYANAWVNVISQIERKCGPDSWCLAGFESLRVWMDGSEVDLQNPNLMIRGVARNIRDHLLGEVVVRDMPEWATPIKVGRYLVLPKLQALAALSVVEINRNKSFCLRALTSSNDAWPYVQQHGRKASVELLEELLIQRLQNAASRTSSHSVASMETAGTAPVALRARRGAPLRSQHSAAPQPAWMIRQAQAKVTADPLDAEIKEPSLAETTWADVWKYWQEWIERMNGGDHLALLSGGGWKRSGWMEVNPGRGTSSMFGSRDDRGFTSSELPSLLSDERIATPELRAAAFIAAVMSTVKGDTPVERMGAGIRTLALTRLCAGGIDVEFPSDALISGAWRRIVHLRRDRSVRSMVDAIASWTRYFLSNYLTIREEAPAQPPPSPFSIAARVAKLREEASAGRVPGNINHDVLERIGISPHARKKSSAPAKNVAQKAMGAKSGGKPPR